jgi:hypothetical protein
MLILALAALVLILTAAALALFRRIESPAWRSSYDHDKETPPKGWPCAQRTPPTMSTGGNLVCASCGFPVGDAETIILVAGKVHHVACARLRRRTIRPDGVGPC